MKNKIIALLILSALSAAAVTGCGTVENIADSSAPGVMQESSSADESLESVTKTTEPSSKDTTETHTTEAAADESTEPSVTSAANEESTVPAEQGYVAGANETSQDDTPAETPEETPAEAPQEEPQTEAPAGSFSSSDMYFNGSTVLMDAGSLVSSLGSPSGVEEAPSCLNNGCDIKIYRYSGINVYTYIDGGSEIIYEIEITGSGYSTGKGLSVGMSLSDAEALYGVGTDVGGGMYCYYDTGTTYMYVITSGGTVTSIGFAAEV